MKKFLVVLLIALIGTTCVFAQEASTVSTSSDDLFALVDGTEVTALEAVTVEGGSQNKKELGCGGAVIIAAAVAFAGGVGTNVGSDAIEEVSTRRSGKPLSQHLADVIDASIDWVADQFTIEGRIKRVKGN